MRLIAEQVDENLGDAVVGVVAYVFETACYVRRPDGSLVLIVSSSTGSMPNGIVVSLPAGVRLSHCVRKAAATTVWAGIIRFAGHGLSIDLRQAETYGPIVSDAKPPADSLYGILDQAYRTLEILSRTRAPEVFEMFAGAPGVRDTDALARLIGAGPGLTPAGDDYLTGLMAAARFAGPMGNDLGNHHRALAEVVEQNVTRTGEVSQTILRGAIRGVFPARLVTLGRHLMHGGGEPAPSDSISALVEFGHSSGASMAYGLIKGVMELFEIVPARQVAA